MQQQMRYLVDEYAAYLVGHWGRARVTARYYHGCVRRAVVGVGRQLGRPAELAELTAERVQRYLDELDTLPVTKQYYLGALRAFFRFCKRRGLCADIGAELEAPKDRRRRLPPVLSRAQVDRLVEAPIRSRTPDRLTALDLRDAALLELLYGAGVRNSEACGLDVATLQFRDGYAAGRLIGKGDKERPIVIEEGKTLDAIRLYLARRDELPGADGPALFLNWYGARLTRRGVVYVVRRWARRVGLECWPHLLRHTFATHMVAEAGESLRGVQELLGHDDPAMTSRYAQIDEARLRKTARLHPRARRAPSLGEVADQAAELGRSAGRLAAHGAGELIERLRKGRPPAT